jgi:hypothetical protein
MPSGFSRALRSRGPIALGGSLFLWAAVAGESPGPPQAVSSAPEEFVVIASPDVPLSGLSLEQLRRVFLFREKYWKPGLPVTVLLTENGLEPGSFLLEHIYRMDYASLRRLIVEKLYQEEIDYAPRVVASDELAVALAASGRGAIAIVRAKAAEGARVKILAVDGLRPGSPGYALRR